MSPDFCPSAEINDPPDALERNATTLPRNTYALDLVMATAMSFNADTTLSGFTADR